MYYNDEDYNNEDDGLSGRKDKDEDVAEVRDLG